MNIDDLLNNAKSKGINTTPNKEVIPFAEFSMATVKALENVGFNRNEAIRILIAAIRANKG